MGRQSRMKAMRKTLKQMGVVDTRPTHIEQMIECPHCGAYSYPRGINDPKNQEEKDAIICGSCKKNLTPYIEEQKRKHAEREELKKGIKIVDAKDAPLELVTDDKEEIGQIQHVSFSSEEERKAEIDRLNAKRDAYLEKHTEETYPKKLIKTPSLFAHVDQVTNPGRTYSKEPVNENT